MKKLLFIIFCFYAIPSLQAQQLVDLQECRQLALENNKTLKIAEENVNAAKSLSKAAFAEFFPNISAYGSYRYNQKNVSLLGEDAHLPIGVLDANGNFGTGITSTSRPTPNADGTFTFEESAINNKFILIDGKPVPLDAQGSPFDPEKNPENLQWKNHAILPKDAMEFDMHNIFVGGISFVQPVFMGGKIVQLNNIAKSNRAIAEAHVQEKAEELLVNVDEAYWRVVSLENKVKLAKEYRNLVAELDKNMQALQEEGLATKADALKIRVKLNEADVSLTKAENGLNLSRMALNQLCGLPLEEQIELKDADLNETIDVQPSFSIEQAWANRPEIKMLTQAGSIAEANTKIMASRFMPTVALTGGYVTTNPNAFKGVEKKFNGMFTVGITAVVPLFHFGQKTHTLNAARTQVVIAKLELEEAKEKIELQIHQNSYRINESLKKQEMTRKNVENAKENLIYAQEGFEAGVITSTDLLMAQTAWLSAESEYLDATVDVKLNNLYLKKSIGNLY
ncbi:TolC family protein [Proteiniphilum sp.]|uniref:TolC family protein n=1 Tax=Proteiniphilum sp. TaxID=1926877 RepID=UPI002B1EC2CC|nr:TolC family protein [Proteiniphilum sp.]MEA4917750.1 TolC family protein [Proteiniphilum sp.]